MKREQIVTKADVQRTCNIIRAKLKDGIVITKVTLLVDLGVARVWYTYKGSTYLKQISFCYETFEELNKHEDPLIADHAIEIIAVAGNPSLYPSWMIMEVALACYKYHLADISNKTKKIVRLYETAVRNHKYCIEYVEWLKNVSVADKTYYDGYREEIDRINALCRAQKNNAEILDENGEVLFYTKQERKAELRSLRESAREHKRCYKKRLRTLKKYQRYAASDGRKKDKYEHPYHQALKLREEGKAVAKGLCEDRIRWAGNLPILTTPERLKVVFVPLKVAMERDEFRWPGCYVIRNRSNGKCYVGRSKDVHHRLHQHFSGTVPKNPNFFEDYYDCPPRNRSELFEVHVFFVQDEDVLPQMERELIARYDSYLHGYNKNTGG